MKRSSIVLILALAAAGCGSSQPEAAAPAKNPAAEPGTTQPPPAKTREELMAEAIGRVSEIEKQVAALRGLPFKQSVPAEAQSKEDFRAYLVREADKELPPEVNAGLSRALFHLGLVKEKVDLRETLLDAMVSQAAAYYDPETNKFFIVIASTAGAMLDVLTAHELTHGIQHQHFDLLAYYGQKPKLNLTEDELNARRFVVEGEATMLMLGYGVSATGKNPFADKDARGLLAMQIKTMAGMDTKMLVDASIAQAKTMNASDPEMAASLQAMDKIPLYVLIPLLESYIRGALPVMETFVAGGWEAVGALYTSPPESTEQVLHPTTKLVGKRDEPVAIAVKKPKLLSKWSEVHTDVMGELQWRSYFTTWSHPKAAPAAEGWDGDRWSVYADGDAMTALIATTWDSEDDAKEFEAAYLETLTSRFPDGKPEQKAGVTTHARPDSTLILVERRGSDVFIIDGAPAASAPKLLAELRKAKKTKHPSEK